MLALTPFAPRALAYAQFEYFQMYNACRPMQLVVENLSPGAAEIGLTREQLQSTVESRLRAARLYTEDLELSDAAYLYVNVNVFAQAFSISLKYNKRVTDAFERIGSAVTRATSLGRFHSGTWTGS